MRRRKRFNHPILAHRHTRGAQAMVSRWTLAIPDALPPGDFYRQVKGAALPTCCVRHRTIARAYQQALDLPPGPCFLCGAPSDWRRRWPFVHSPAEQDSMRCRATPDVEMYVDCCAACRHQPMAALEAAIAHKLKREAPAFLPVNHDLVDFRQRPTCCATCQLAYDQVRAVCGASFEAFGAQWRTHAPTILAALDAPSPCLLCGEKDVVTGALYRSHTPAMFGHKVAIYFLCKACYALPSEELSLRTEAMLARCLVGHRN